MPEDRGTAAEGRYKPQQITVELIRRLLRSEPPDRPREIRDRTAGLILRHQPSGYIGLYAHLGRGKRERLCDASRIVDAHSSLTLNMAKAEARRLQVQQADGRDFAAERAVLRSVPTLRVFLTTTYGPWAKRNRRSGAATLARIEAVFSALLDAKLTDLTPMNLETWRSARQQTGVTAETINRDLNALRGALSQAVKLQIIPTNPLHGLERAQVDRHKRVVRALTAGEKTKLIETLQSRDDEKRSQRERANKWRSERGYELKPVVRQFADALTPAVIVSLETGLRRGELFHLEWPFVDFKEKTLSVRGPTAKTFETREMPLNDIAYQTLLDWWRQCGEPKEGYVFANRGSRVTSLKKSYQHVLASANIERVNPKGERVNWHSLRHTFGSLLGAAKVDPTTLMKLMGHANLETTQRYLHTDQDRKRAAVETLVSTER